ncbi:hypothetical protein [Virgibacillus sp. CBA3643]
MIKVNYVLNGLSKEKEFSSERIARDFYLSIKEDKDFQNVSISK